MPVEDSLLFKGLTFYLDINRNGAPNNDSFTELIKSLGGTVTTDISSKITHLLWGQGSIETLKRAQGIRRLRVVSTLWIKEC